MNLLAMLQNATGKLPNWAIVTPEEAEAEYRRELMEPYGGINSYEEFQAFQSGIGGPEDPAKTIEERKMSVWDVTNKAAKFAVLGPAAVAPEAARAFGGSAGKWVVNGGVVLFGVILMIGAFFLMARKYV